VDLALDEILEGSAAIIAKMKETATLKGWTENAGATLPGEEKNRYRVI
jgi:hypothetical protein